MMRERNIIRPNRVGSTIQKSMPLVARPFFKIRRAGQPFRPFHNQLNLKPRTHLAHKLLVAIRLRAANPMVQMTCSNFQMESFVKFEERMHQRNRISPTRKPNEDRRPAPNRKVLQRLRNNIRHNISRIATHKMRLFPR
jgi:hypothetical protein